MVREGGGVEAKSIWETALKKVAEGLRAQSASLGVLASASSTTSKSCTC